MSLKTKMYGCSVWMTKKAFDDWKDGNNERLFRKHQMPEEINYSKTCFTFSPYYGILYIARNKYPLTSGIHIKRRVYRAEYPLSIWSDGTSIYFL